MPLRTAATWAGLSALVCACSPTTSLAPLSATPILPLRTLRLYETGVGYFERAGDPHGATSLPVPAGHLDDALKTLVVLGPNGKTSVRGIEFASSVSRGMARALAGLPVDGDEPLGLEQLLVGLKGARVEVRAAKGEVQIQTGRIVDVVEATPDGVAARGPAAPAEAQGDASANEARAAVKSAEPTRALTLLLLTDAGAIVRIPAAAVTSVRPLDPTYAARLGSALDALSTRGARSERRLDVLAQGGPITLGYVAETPVWRTTYRLVLDDAATSGVLQGWALLHNDTDEDWRGVRVELANGRPDSFLVPLAAPRYARRPLVAPDDPLATVPQLMRTTVDAIWGDHVGDDLGGAGLSGTGEGGGGTGEGIGLGGFGTLGHGAGNAIDGKLETSAFLKVGDLAATAAADGAESGALFVYTLADPVDLHAHASALVPFEQARVDVRPIAWLDGPGRPARAAVRIVNSTPQTLPSGTLAVFADGGFAGESSLPRVKPGERRFVTYGADLDVELRTQDQTTASDIKRLVSSADGHALAEHYLATTDTTYTIENRSGLPRTVVLALEVDRNATLTGADEIDFDVGSGHPVAVFTVGARKKVERKTHVVEGLARNEDTGSLTAERAAALAAAPSLDARDRASIGEAAAHLREAEDDDRLLAQAKADVAEVTRDLDRLRDHMKAFAGERAGGAGANPFAARVLAGEDRLSALRKKIEGLESSAKAKRERAQAALARLGT